MDLYFFHLVNQFAGKNVCLDSAAIFFAEYFQYFVVLLLILLLAVNFRKYLKMAVVAVIAAIFSRFIITEIIRFIFPRSRPFVENNVNLILQHSASESSFPSGHAAFYFAIAAVVYFYNKKVGIFSGWLVVKVSKRLFKPKAPQLKCTPFSGHE